MRGSLFITFFNRNSIFLKNLKILTKCKDYKKFNKLIIYQNPDYNIVKKIKKIDKNIKIISTVYDKNYTIFSKVNNNIYKGFCYCFEKYKSDFVIHLEDDLKVGYDFLFFINKIISKHNNDKMFYAVNGFSKEYKLKTYSFNYSKFIYGIGKGWAIPKANWSITKIKLKEVIKKRSKRFFDVHLEKFIKFNFYVIMPYRSRILEEVSNGLTLKESFNETKFFKHWSNSFIRNINVENEEYKYIKDMKYNWRYDCLHYNLINKVISFILYYFTKIFYYSIYIKKTIKKFV
jgi:hypothetical protein